MKTFKVKVCESKQKLVDEHNLSCSTTKELYYTVDENQLKYMVKNGYDIDFSVSVVDKLSNELVVEFTTYTKNAQLVSHFLTKKRKLTKEFIHSNVEFMKRAIRCTGSFSLPDYIVSFDNLILFGDDLIDKLEFRGDLKELIEKNLTEGQQKELILKGLL